VVGQCTYLHITVYANRASAAYVSLAATSASSMADAVLSEWEDTGFIQVT
jgi:hypothetical protein